MDEATVEDIGPRLLEHLRVTWGAPSLAYRAPPERILGGNATYIHGFELEDPPSGCDGPLVLRLFRADQGAEWVRVEATIQAGVADLGYPAPRVVAVCTDHAVLGAPFMVMARVPGTTLFSSVAPTTGDAMHVDLARLALELPRSVGALPGVIAEWLVRLHEVDAAPVLERLRAEDVAPEVYQLDREGERIAANLRGAPAATRSAFAPALEWIERERPREGGELAVCHGDFHPLNLMAEAGHVTAVIDWTDACLAPADYDVAQSRFLFELGPLSLPPALRRVAAWGQRWLAHEFFKQYRKRREVDVTVVDYYEGLRIVRELVGVARERLIEQGAVAGAARPSGNPWGRPGRVAPLVRRFAKISGLRLAVPGL